MSGVALALTLAACGSSSDDNSSSAPASTPASAAASAAASGESVTPDRQTLIDEIRADGEASGAPAEQIDCVIDAIDALDAEQLQSIKDGTPNEETQQVMAAASAKCLPSSAASPAAS